MNLEKFTERSRGFLQAAQTIAMRENHQKLAPGHLLKALLDDQEGLAANLIRRAGGSPERVAQATELALRKLPQVSGDAGQVYMDQQTAKVLDEAEKIATKAGDSFVPVERILTALAVVRSPAKEALAGLAVAAESADDCACTTWRRSSASACHARMKPQPASAPMPSRAATSSGWRRCRLCMRRASSARRGGAMPGAPRSARFS